MSGTPQGAIGFGRTLRLLLGAARLRAKGRRRRQRELLAQRTGKAATDWGFFGVAAAAVFMAILNGGAGFVLIMAVDAGERLNTELQGKIVVDGWFYQSVLNADRQHIDTSQPGALRYGREAASIKRRDGGSAAGIEQRLRNAVESHGAGGLVPTNRAEPGMEGIARTGRLPDVCGSLILLWWGIMLVFQGEGLELDIQRQRHPLWEWIFSHPVSPWPVFLGEILTPIAANPVYWTGPLFAGVVYGSVYGFRPGIFAIFLVGIPITVAAACLGKGIEVAVILRFAPRTRGAVIGLMSWIGYASMMLFLFVGLVFASKLIPLLSKVLIPLAAAPWPFLRLFLGGPWPSALIHTLPTAGLAAPDGFSFVAGVLTCWAASVLAVTCGVWFTVWGTQRGLAGASADVAPRTHARSAHFGSEPLYRKEFLWFVRDRSAIVQAILIPLTMAGFQVFNLRGILTEAGGAWNYLCGAAILFGTYFLWVLGPKSLASEGQALWITLTWPRGLENLLKAKAWLWSVISSALVFLVLGWAAYLFPRQILQIALVGVGWWFFARSMADKSVTLVTVPSSAGEPEPLPRNRRGAAQLGMLTFAVGVISRQWNLAVIGIVFSWITAAAMWQNFRARLPYLYDPWSEKVPPPPTLMHAMIAISVLIEGAAVLSGAGAALLPKEEFPVALALAYGISATAVFAGTSLFFARRGVAPNQIWTWAEGEPPTPRKEQTLDDYLAHRDLSFAEKFGLTGGGLVPALLAGLIVGAALGGLAHGYTALLHHIPMLTDLLRNVDSTTSRAPGLRVAYAITAIAFAPFAEEYLFRGLLYRALDRNWGGWRAILGAAAFFTIYHPLLAWPLVFSVGAVNCLLFRRTKRLLPCIVLHMAYNTAVFLR